MTHIFKFLFSILLLSNAIAANSIAFTAATTSPQDKNVLLLNQGNNTYLIHNISQQSVWVDHPTKNHSASAGWASFIRPGHWSVLKLDKKNFLISCSQIQPGEVVYLDCSKTIAIHSYPIPLQKKGTYWIVEDKSQDEMLKILSNKVKTRSN